MHIDKKRFTTEIYVVFNYIKVYENMQGSYTQRIALGKDK